MTITELCDLPNDELDKMSMTQLEEFFKPFWPTTRPEKRVSSIPADKEKAGGMVTKGMLGGRSFGHSRKPNVDRQIESKLPPEKVAWLKERGLL